MARQARHSRDELRELALVAAEDIIAEEGFEQLTVRRVAGRIGYSVGMLYNAFENFEDLILNVDARTLDLLHGALGTVERTGVPAEDLDALLEAYLQFITAHPNRWLMLFSERLPGVASPPDWYLERVARVFTLLEETLAPCFVPADPQRARRAARLLWIGLHGVWSLAAGDKLAIVTPEPAGAVARQMARAFLAGLPAGIA